MFARNVLVTFITELFIMALNFAISVLVARWLGPSRQGIYALVTMLPVTLAYFASLGVTQATIYLINRRRVAPRAVAGNSITLALLMGLGLGLVAYVVQPLARRTVLKGVTRTMFWVAVGVTPLFLLDGYLLALLRALGDFPLFNLRRLLTPVLSLLGLSIALLMLKGGLRAAILVYVAVALLTTIWLLARVNRRVPLRPRFNPALIRQAVTYGAKSHIQSLVGHLNYRVDLYIVAALLDPRQVAFYSVAISLINLVWYIPNSIGIVLFPRLSASSVEDAHRFTAIVCRHTLALIIIAALGLGLVGPWLIPLVYKADYQPAVLPMLFLLPGVVAMGLYKVLSRNFSSRNKQEVSIAVASLSLMVNVGLDLALIPRLGLIGAAVSSGVAYLIAGGLLLGAFYRVSGLSIREVLCLHRADLDMYGRFVSQAKVDAQRWLLRLALSPLGIGNDFVLPTRYRGEQG